MPEPAPATPRSRDELARGTRIARYTLLDAIGSGGIGIVYTAYDPDLDRRVALKLLRPSKLAGRRTTIQQRRARLLREAQALARLSHPNVVPIYEVGTFGAQIYLIMEFIDGLTLGAWFRGRARRWPEVIGMFIQAGRGLAAAHEAGIVHRDFKPDNVLVGHDGRVRVLDFGLAGPLRAQDSTEKVPIEIESDSDERSDERSDEDSSEHARIEAQAAVTRDGQVLGTPAYMAPEQSQGGQVDARSDQFGFCVALYEALYGQRPFRGRYDDARRYVDLGKARARGRLPGKRPGDMPGEIERILLRGLSLDPERRFPSMRSLLDELEAIAQPTRRWWWLPLGLIGLAAATVIGFMTATTQEPEPRACDDGSDLLIGVWDADVAAELQRAAEATARASIVEMAADAGQSLDEWAQRWRRARLRACETSSTRSDPSAELLEQRLACLDRQLVRIDSTLAGLRRLFDERPESLPERLDAIGEGLPDPHDCEAAPLIERKHLLPRDPTLASTIASLADELAMVEGRFDGDKDYEAAYRASEALLVRARASEFDPLIAEVLLLVGEIDYERARENTGDAELRLSDAAWTAQRAGHDEVLVTAAAKLVDMCAREGRIEPARLWAQLGRATLARLGNDTPAEAELQLALAELETAEGDFEGALREREDAIELLQRLDRTHHRSYLRAELAQASDLRELGRYDDAAQLLERNRRLVVDVHGPNHPRVAEVLDALSVLRSSQGQRDEALRLGREALALTERVHGKDSLEVAKVLNNLAIVLDQSGRFSEAAEVLERARAIFSRLEGEHSRTVAYVDVNLGQALHNLGRYDEAAPRYESALVVLIEIYGPDHPAVAVTKLNLAVTRTHGDDIEAALVQLEAGCVQLEGLLGPDHPDLAELEHERARALRELGRLDEAKRADQRALVLLENTFGKSHGGLLLPLTGLAETELALGHADEALALVERIESLLLDDETPPIAAAEAKFVAGRVLLGAGHERGQRLIGEARALAERTEGGGELLGRIEAVAD